VDDFYMPVNRHLVAVGVNHNATGKTAHVNFMLSCLNGTYDFVSDYQTSERVGHSFYVKSSQMAGSPQQPGRPRE